jgi:superfamily II DNA/RNA helicase
MKLIPHKFTAISLFLAARSSYGFSHIRIQSGPSSTAVLSSSTDQNEGDDDEINAPSFSDLGIDDDVLNAIWSRPDWLHPTPVQQLAIPRLLEGDERTNSSSDAFWCEAPTGSGKTITYLIPLIQNLLMLRKQRQQQQTRGKDKERITALVLVPTRELCIQIGSVLDQLVDDIPQPQQRKLSTMVLHGGTLLTPQIVRLSDCAQYKTTIDVIVATPGRLIDVITSYAQDGGNHHAQDAAMERRLLQALDDQPDDDLSLEQLQKLGLDSISHEGDNDDDDDDFDSSDGRNELINVLGGLQYLILDEADRLLGNGFRGELDSVLDLISSKPTTWLFSATLPKSIEPRLDNVLSSIGATNSPVRLVCSNSDRKMSEDASVSSSLQKKLQHSSTVSSASQYQQVGPASTINLRTIRMEKSARTQVLRKLLQQDYKDDWDRVLVFVSTRYASEHVSKKLRRAGISSSELHGKLDQDARLRRLDDLKKGKIRVLLCTDVASRGIDISGLVRRLIFPLPLCLYSVLIAESNNEKQLCSYLSFLLYSLSFSILARCCKLRFATINIRFCSSNWANWTSRKTGNRYVND